MSKVFTITEGLENLGALKTGGQGSVYKARRTGTMITAVKLLPTPLHTENPDDKNYRDFLNEVEKLKRVNETPNPNVVRILSSGITDSGSFPFIEMEFIEGPDLEELLKPPHDPLFTIKETVRVAEDLAHALAHCHRLQVKHGDVKSNNVKFNIHTGNYMLLDFGLAIMSDEQRRSSLRHAGAIEFMAPEQSSGAMLFQTDVYSFGIILYELLAGRVPFPLRDRSETTRNQVLVAHLETPPPDMLQLRQEHLPAAWARERKEQELRVPLWLQQVVSQCLEKDPALRFPSGVELQDFIHKHSVGGADSGGTGQEEQLQQLLRENKKLKEDKEQLQAVVQRLQQSIAAAASGTVTPAPATPPLPVKTPGWGRWILGLMILGLILFLVVLFANRDGQPAEQTFVTDTSRNALDSGNSTAGQSSRRDRPRIPEETLSPGTQTQAPATSSSVGDPGNSGSTRSGADPNAAGNTSGTPYKVRAARAYFHDRPDPDTRRDAYLIPSDDIIYGLEEQGDFLYVEFTNSAGQVSKGWIPKEDLAPLY